MKKFIYVFNNEAKNKLLSLGYNLIKNDDNGHVYIFNSENKSRTFSADIMDGTIDVSYILSDSLTF